MPATRLTGASTLRRTAWVSLLLVVTAGHVWLWAQLPDSRLGEGAADEAPRAIDVAFVRELAPTAPPVHVAAAPPAAPALSVERPAPPASAASASVPAAEPAGASPEPVLADAPMAVAPGSGADTSPLPSPPVAASSPLAAASAPAPAAFDWPPSTRLSYELLGNYRGPLHGTAQVDWLRDGPRYQVRLEVHLALVVTRRMLSDGVLGPDGLIPRRYDEETEVPFRETRRLTVQFEPDRILMANGKTQDPVAGVQDTASQFVQMTWLYLTHPERLKVGQSVEFPLALPRRLGRWTYDVAEQAELALPFGNVNAFHLVPRAGARRANEMELDFWIAPSLQYLPVKITIRMDAENYAELSLDRRPLQAGSLPASAPARIVR